MNKLTVNKKASALMRNRFLKWGMELMGELFPVLLVTYLVLILLETVFPRSVSLYLNLNHLLAIVIAVGVVAVLVTPAKTDSTGKRRLSVKSIGTIVVAGVSGAAIIWYKTQDIGWISYIVSAVSGGLIVILSLLIWQGEEAGEIEGENSQDN